MTGKAAGQLAYEAGPLGWVGRGIWPPVPWEKLTPQDHAWWDKVARANDPWPDWALLADARREAEALREQVRLARQDRDQLRKHVLDLAAGLENSAAATAPSKKSGIENDLAARLRQVAEPPS